MATENSHSNATAVGALAHGGHDDGAVHVHIATAPFYVGIFAALIALTILTVAVSYYDFGEANIIVALLIATAKGSLVATFFMHLRHDKLFNVVAFLSAFLFLALFILLTYDDLGTRGKALTGYIESVDPRSGQPAPGGEPATTATAIETAPPEAPEEPSGKAQPKE